MKLKSIQITNYRSIDDITFEIEELKDKSFSYGLIGVNEAGKSTILKALGLKDGLKNAKGETLPIPKDFRDRTQDISITYDYSLSKGEIKAAKEFLRTTIVDAEIEKIDLTNVKLTCLFEFTDPLNPIDVLEVQTIVETPLKEKIQEALVDFILDKAHKSVFWTAEERFLISQPINIANFAADPDKISIPLKNCFSLAGMDTVEKIKDRISFIGESTERESLKDDLGRSVTDHINSVWKDHPIKITFDISDGLINFHVHDLQTRGKAKTADQRSDGFGQFVSFLLTVSAQNKNQELSNTILLIDEPETHLHPRAQEDLLKEIVSITQNNRNNIALFATHSNYLIDKKDLSRNYKVSKTIESKIASEKTVVTRFNTTNSTYASVTYEVFDIPSTDYHNELYSKLHEIYQNQDLNDEKRSQILNFDTVFFHKDKKQVKDKPWKGNPKNATLPTYIRNCIHHSDNGDTYTEIELRESIELLKRFL
jgi:predicted ATP-dependent endonuclease of OLD family